MLDYITERVWVVRNYTIPEGNWVLIHYSAFYTTFTKQKKLFYINTQNLAHAAESHRTKISGVSPCKGYQFTLSGANMAKITVILLEKANLMSNNSPGITHGKF